MIPPINLCQHLTEWTIKGAAAADGRKLAHVAKSFQIIEPLVLRIKVDPDDVEEPFLPAQFGPDPARQHVPGLKLGEAKCFRRSPFYRMVGRGYDVNDRVDVEEARQRF